LGEITKKLENLNLPIQIFFKELELLPYLMLKEAKA